MTFIRSFLYLVIFLAWTLAVALIGLPFLVKRRGALGVMRLWSRGVTFLARWIIDVRFEIRGQENLPDGPCIVAAQHQSAFETYILFMLFEYPVFILKESLQWIPLVGWYIKRAGLITINRSAGANAMRHILRGADAAISRGESVLIFPEGTRTAPGQRQDYKPGIVALYNHCQAPLIPMALNTGHIWGKTRLTKLPGLIVFEFLPAIPVGLERAEFLAELRTRMETASEALPKPDGFPPAEGGRTNQKQGVL
ncbi:MAG: 1-acyl-sn-glycerol-3-phosphate acyltransferase [Alphaproteobacteria bacterium]|nr:1-acyl-sn-glycerol-3-phosphate acyltransferase [Alphaproteobacteria bacterium]